MPGIKAVFFDIGDTLVFDRPDRRKRFHRACQAVGLAFDESAFAAAFSRSEDYAVSRYLEGLDWETEIVMRACAQITLDALGAGSLTDSTWRALRDAFLAITFDRYVPDEARRILEDLRARGFQLGAISDWESTLRTDLDDLDLSQFMEVVAVSTIVGERKPNARLFQDALRQAHILPAESLHVGDWFELDVAGARAAGMAAVLFDPKGRCAAADVVRAGSFAELSEYLCDLPNPV